MEVFSVSAGQTMVLFTLIIAGFLLARIKAVPENTAQVLSKLENNIFVPALVMLTFINNFTAERIGAAGGLFVCGLVTCVIMMGISVLIVRFFSRDEYIRRIYTYGLVFSNFGFMGNAVVSAVFPEYFTDYLIFTLPMWMLIYMWGVPFLLIPPKDGKRSVAGRVKALINPMFIALVIGILIGILKIKLPDFIMKVLDSASDCMSPVAMLLTGVTLASTPMKKMLSVKSIYAVSFVRLLVFPLLTIGFLLLIPVDKNVAVCAVCAMAMPLGLNTIVVPRAYGLDTSVAAGMTFVSHLMSVITIPAVFWLMMKVAL